ncbi:MAG TPA: hypothetical protein VHY32_00855 [Caulobacteraceae bacterium]|nr:hypothetical protein [Caulobacteraceae bacterium]
MTKTKLRRMGSPYAVGEGDLFPVFFPHYIGRWGGTQILGNIGLYVKPFELWWLDITSKFRKNDEMDGPIIGIYISNFRSMIGASAFLATEQVEIEDWAAKIAELAHQIFEPGKDVFDIVCSEKLAGFGLRSYTWPSVKTYAFNIWLHLQRPGIKVPIDLKWLDEQCIASRQQEYDFLQAHYGHIDP